MIQLKTLEPDQAKLKVLAEDDNADATGILEGYASVFDNVDLGGEVVVKGAFAKTLKERLKKGFIKLYDSHMVFSGSEALIGLVTDAKEDDYGLWFRAKFSSVQRAQEVRTKIREGIMNALSFGYEVVKDTVDQEKKVRYLKELRLYEISVVPWGMNPKAAIELVKGSAGDGSFMPKQEVEPPAPPPAPTEEDAMTQEQKEALALEEAKQKKELDDAAKNSPIASAVRDYRNDVQIESLKFALTLQTAQIRSGLGRGLK